MQSLLLGDCSGDLWPTVVGCRAADGLDQPLLDGIKTSLRVDGDAACPPRVVNGERERGMSCLDLRPAATNSTTYPPNVLPSIYWVFSAAESGVRMTRSSEGCP